MFENGEWVNSTDPNREFGDPKEQIENKERVRMTKSWHNPAKKAERPRTPLQKPNAAASI